MPQLIQPHKRNSDGDPLQSRDPTDRSLVLFLILLVCSAIFIGMTSHALPARVASHFVANGVANGFMPRAIFMKFIMSFSIGVPLIMVLFIRFTMGRRSQRINLPHREYWLAPEREQATIRYLKSHSTYLGVFLLLFLDYVHWMVVCANAAPIPTLPQPDFFIGLGAFIAAILIWMIALFIRFGKIPE